MLNERKWFEECWMKEIQLYQNCTVLVIYKLRRGFFHGTVWTKAPRSVLCSRIDLFSRNLSKSLHERFFPLIRFRNNPQKKMSSVTWTVDRVSDRFQTIQVVGCSCQHEVQHGGDNLGFQHSSRWHFSLLLLISPFVFSIHLSCSWHREKKNICAESGDNRRN